MAQIQYKFNKNDEYYTPAYAVYPIVNNIKKVLQFGVHLTQKIVNL